MGTKLPGSESSTPGTFAGGSEWSWERKVHNSLKPDSATAWMTAQLKMWKLSLTRTPDSTDPRSGVLTLTDPRRGYFWKLAITDIHCMRGRACAQSYIHSRLQHLGCAVIRAVLRSYGQVLGTQTTRAFFKTCSNGHSLHAWCAGTQSCSHTWTVTRVRSNSVHVHFGT